jgi:hypothetical protein
MLRMNGLTSPYNQSCNKENINLSQKRSNESNVADITADFIQKHEQKRRPNEMKQNSGFNSLNERDHKTPK